MTNRSRAATRDERGAVLALFALLLVGIFAFMALLIDLGLARIAQDQMQVVADGAALEGLHWRDEVTDPARRGSVSARIALAFDDDWNLANGDRGTVGAGPIFNLQDGIGEANASALLTLGDPPVYKPVLAENLANVASGDQVEGTYFPIPVDGGGLPIAPALAHQEDPNYGRADFAPGAGDSYLVRLRRTRDVLGLDRVAGQSNGGPPIPYLFGLGGAISAAGPAYDPRRDGITVRATAIATARRALAATDAPGVGPVLLRAAVPLARWLALAPDTPSPFAVGGSVLTINDAPFADSLDPAIDRSVQWVGRPLVFGGTIGAIPPRLIVPVFDVFDSVPRVIGFGQLLIDPGGGLITKRAAGTVLHGASAGINRLTLPAIRALDPQSPAVIPGLLAAHDQVDAPLLAPVIAR